MRNGGKGSANVEEWINGGASGQIAPKSGERRWRRSRLFGSFSGNMWLIDGGRCLGFDGRRFMIRLVVVASGSMTENESKHLGRWPRAEAFVSVLFRFFF